MMRVSYVSDTHNNDIELSDDIDVLIVAGDVSNTVSAVGERLNSLKEDHPSMEIIFVPGNHDLLYSEKTFDESQLSLRNWCDEINVHFLYNESVIIDGVKFYGTTLWSNLRSYGIVNESHTKQTIKYDISDFQNHDWTVYRMLDEFDKAHKFLCDAQQETYHGKKFVVTHFSPSLKSVAPKYKSDPLSAFFCNDIEGLTSGIDYWVHGHVHSPFDYQIRDCRVLCNPVGYRNKYNIENPLYKEQIIEI